MWRGKNLSKKGRPASYGSAQDQQCTWPSDSGPSDGQKADYCRDGGWAARSRDGHHGGTVWDGVYYLYGGRGHAETGAECDSNEAFGGQGGGGNGWSENIEGSGERGDARLGYQCSDNSLRPRHSIWRASLSVHGARVSSCDWGRGPRAIDAERGETS